MWNRVGKEKKGEDEEMNIFDFFKRIYFNSRMKWIKRLVNEGYYKGALWECEKLMTFLPNFPSVHNELSYLYMGLGMADISLFHAKKAICLCSQKQFTPFMNLGVAYIHLNSPLNATYALNKAEDLRYQVHEIEYGKLLIFRAEARCNFEANKQFALEDLEKGKYIFEKWSNDNTAKFWLEQIPRRKAQIEKMEG